MAEVKDNITIQNARIIFRNFSGKAGRFNAAGQRNFCVLLDPVIAEQMAQEGWNVKWLTPRDPDDPRQPYIQVKVNYDGDRPPSIVLVTKKRKTPLGADTVSMLDFAEIENVDLTFRPYNWDVSGKKGVKAYLKKMFITIVEDPLEEKYREVPDSALDNIDEDDGG